jgi:hypothetical protein
MVDGDRLWVLGLSESFRSEIPSDNLLTLTAFWFSQSLMAPICQNSGRVESKISDHQYPFALNSNLFVRFQIDPSRWHSFQAERPNRLNFWNLPICMNCRWVDALDFHSPGIKINIINTFCMLTSLRASLLTALCGLSSTSSKRTPLNLEVH